MSLRIWLFDHLRVTAAAGAPRAVRPRAQRLLAFLLLHRQRPLTREQIAFTLWPDSPESRALGTLRRALSDLRAALASPEQGDWVEVSDTSLRWNAGAPCWIDVDAFEQAVRQASPAALHEAVDLYAGDLLAGWDDEWVASERERLRQLQVSALRQLVGHHRALGGHETALGFARRVLAHDPLAEVAHRDLIGLLYEAGDRGAALAAYDRLRALLDQELGVEPMAESLALRDAIIRGAPLLLVTGPAGANLSPDSGPRDRPNLVGRDAELAALRSLWERAGAGEGGLVTVSGAAGVGKSHLMRALTGDVAAAGGLPLAGHCYEFEQALPYQAVVEMLRAAAPLLRHAELPAAHRPALARLAPDVLGASGVVSPESDVLTGDPRAQLFEALWQAFLALARNQPLLLVIEDTHWAAESVIDWLTYITPRLEGAPILVAVTYRTEEVEAGRPLARLNRRLARAARVTALTLTPLSPEAHRELVGRLSGLPDDVSSRLADRLFEETAGNPFFLQEIVRGLIETGQIVVSRGRWEGAYVDAPGAGVPLPDSLRDLITARVERLEQMSRTFIQVAAVAGRVFRYGAVQRATGWSDEPALQALEDVLARGFIGQHDGQEDFAFAHHLIQEVIYGGMTAPRRIFWHRRLAEAIQALQPDDVESLAHHFSRAGDDDRARVYYAQAGDRALQLAALDDAARYYRAALDRWPKADSAGRAELLYKRGQCQWVLSELHAALATFAEAIAMFKTLGNRLRIGDIERMTGRIYWELNDRRASLDHYHRALALLEQEPESIELARAVGAIAQMHCLAWEHDEAIAWGERALALAERLGAEDVAVHAQTSIGQSLVSPNDVERGLALLRDSLRRALAANLAHDAMRTYVGLAEQLLALGRYAESRETFEALLEYAQRVHSDLFTGVALKSLVQLEWWTGHWREAFEQCQKLLGWMRISSHPHLATVWANGVLGMIHNDLGQPDHALRVLEHDLEAARSAAEPQTTVPHLAELARAYSALEQDTEAASTLSELLPWVENAPHLSFPCVVSLLAACHVLATNSAPSAFATLSRCVRQLERAVDEIGTGEIEASLAEAGAVELLAGGEPGEAAELLQRAVAGWEALGRPYDEARALTALGSALRRAGRAPAARAALDQALELSDELAAQIPDAGDRAAFRNSPLIRELREARSRI